MARFHDIVDDPNAWSSHFNLMVDVDEFKPSEAAENFVSFLEAMTGKESGQERKILFHDALVNLFFFKFIFKLLSYQKKGSNQLWNASSLIKFQFFVSNFFL